MSNKYPTLHSRVNGIKINLLPGQANILHRFTNPENQLVIDKIENIGEAPVEEETLVVPSEPEAVVSKATGKKASAAPQLPQI